MRSRPAVLVMLLALLALVPVPVAALDWAIGGDLGFNVYMPSEDYGEDVDGFAGFGSPLGGTLGGMPMLGGLRVSFMGDKPTHEVWLGTSVSFGETGGHSASYTLLTANYQYNLAGRTSICPYVTVGAGLISAGYGSSTTDRSATAVLWGLGAGVSHNVSNGAGRLRAELRYDRLNEGDSEGSVLVYKGSNLGIRLGLDLWFK